MLIMLIMLVYEDAQFHKFPGFRESAGENPSANQPFPAISKNAAITPSSRKAFQLVQLDG